MNAQDLFVEMEQHLLKDDAPSNYLASIADTPALELYPFHLLKLMQDTNQSPRHHPEGNVWNHTLLVVDQAAQRKSQSASPRVFMWAALLHDIGKPSTTKIRKGKITAYNHDKVGAALAEEFLSYLNQEPSFISSVCNLIRYHMQILYVVKGLPYADIDAMMKNADIGEVALLGLCDRLGRTGVNQQAEEENIQRFLALCRNQKKGGSYGTQQSIYRNRQKPRRTGSAFGAWHGAGTKPQGNERLWNHDKITESIHDQPYSSSHHGRGCKTADQGGCQPVK